MASSAIITLILIFISTSIAEIRFSEIRSNSHSIITLDEFGFTMNGRIELNISNLSFSSSKDIDAIDFSKLGFLILKSEYKIQIFDQIHDGYGNKIACSLPLNFTKQVYNLNSLTKGVTSFNHYFIQPHADRYRLVFANCLPEGQVSVSMDVRSAMYNLNDKSNTRDYLSAGMSIIPRVCSFFSLIYFAMAVYWAYFLYKKRLNLFGVHYFMLAVLILKALNLIFEGADKLYINQTGSAYGWEHVMFYIFSFLKGITLFTSIVLIGSGWSFFKPYLNDEEKKVLMVVIPLQVVANIIQVVIDKSGPINGEIWKMVFTMFNLACCVFDLKPILWSTNNLKNAARTDGKAAEILMKLKLFTRFYFVVLCYLYIPEIVVSGFEIMTSSKYLWASVVVVEIANIAFYVFTGYSFKPEAHNLYLPVDNDDDLEAAKVKT